MSAKEHPLLERVLGPLTLRLIRQNVELPGCSEIWHGELHEDDNPNNPIWTSRGEYSREPVEKSAAEFATYERTEVVEL